MADRITGRRITLARQRWAPKVQAGEVTCPRCHLLILPDQPWDLGHLHDLALGGDPAGPMIPEHRRCNRRAGAELGQLIRAPRAARRRLGDWLR